MESNRRAWNQIDEHGIKDPLKKSLRLHPEVQKLKDSGVDLEDHHAKLWNDHHYQPKGFIHENHVTSNHSGINDAMLESYKHWRQHGEILRSSKKEIQGSSEMDVSKPAGPNNRWDRP